MSDSRRVLITITAEYEIQLTDPFFANAYPGCDGVEDAVELDRASIIHHRVDAMEVLTWAEDDTIQINLELLPEKP